MKRVLIWTGIAVLIALLLVPWPRHEDRVPERRDVLRKDLRDLATAQELHAAATGRYGDPRALTDFSFAEGVSLGSWHADSTSWSAVVIDDASGLTCELRVVADSAGTDPVCSDTAEQNDFQQNPD